jgi:hypothetical protein
LVSSVFEYRKRSRQRSNCQCRWIGIVV